MKEGEGRKSVLGSLCGMVMFISGLREREKEGENEKRKKKPTAVKKYV